MNVSRMMGFKQQFLENSLERTNITKRVQKNQAKKRYKKEALRW